MVNQGKARFFKNSQGRYLIYIPVDLAEDSMFPFKTSESVHVHIGFKQGENKLTICEWKPKDTSNVNKVI